MELVCRTAWEMRQAMLCVFLQCVSEQLNSGRKGALSEKWENFLFSWNFYTFLKHVFWWFCAKVVFELNDSRVISSTEVWRMPYLLVLLYSWQATHLHACMHRYIYTYTHTPHCWQADTHACIHTHGAGGWLILHISESKETSLLCLDLVCGLTATKPCVQMNTIKNHFAPKHVYSWAQLVLGLKCIPFVLSAK